MYSSFAKFDEYAPLDLTGKKMDQGQGIETLSKKNMTILDSYKTGFLLTNDHRQNYNNMGEVVLKGVMECSKLSDLFFSDKNIQRIQKKLKVEVFNRTNGKYILDADQDKTKLALIMRNIYLEYALNQPKNLVRQTKKLNKLTVDAVVPGIITNIKQYYGYIKDINQPLKPMNRPVNMNSAGRNSLPSFTTTWGV
jgi:hypothetical protein